jgi:hypothetical protein
MSQVDKYYNRVLGKNTFWFFNTDFEERYDTEHLYVLTTLLLNLQAEVKQHGNVITKNVMHDFLQQENGLRAILALKGDLKILVEEAANTKRKMDFIIPNKKQPVIIAESSYLATTSSGQGDKSKTELSIKNLLAQYYPNAKFIGFVDGIGWYVRKEDLKRMVSAYDDVFTFHKDELDRFRLLIIEELNL